MTSLRNLDASLSFIEERSLPATVTLPEVGRCTPATMFRRVVFPLPDLPMIATKSPDSSFKDTWSTALNAMFPRT
ncbi:MAG: hypothetical protein IKP53_06870 [Candidatus Methanomethylophilaceae archaeon]|nr:hypothetical protein [Candidatus Methanomethylophilaceae archaeon]MBR7005936.1 hypothetical protein [Candidatus Methanomethylophilaceae archaeon]